MTPLYIWPHMLVPTLSTIALARHLSEHKNFQNKGKKYRQAMIVQRKIEPHSSNNFCSGRAVSITYPDHVFVALCIQHAMRMRHILLSFVACPFLQYFSTLSHKRHDFREKLIEHKMCVLNLTANVYEMFLILGRTDRDMIKNVYWFSSLIFGRF